MEYLLNILINIDFLLFISDYLVTNTLYLLYLSAIANYNLLSQKQIGETRYNILLSKKFMGINS